MYFLSLFHPTYFIVIIVLNANSIDHDQTLRSGVLSLSKLFANVPCFYGTLGTNGLSGLIILRIIGM